MIGQGSTAYSRSPTPLTKMQKHELSRIIVNGRTPVDPCSGALPSMRPSTRGTRFGGVGNVFRRCITLCRVDNILHSRGFRIIVNGDRVLRVRIQLEVLGRTPPTT